MKRKKFKWPQINYKKVPDVDCPSAVIYWTNMESGERARFYRNYMIKHKLLDYSMLNFWFKEVHNINLEDYNTDSPVNLNYWNWNRYCVFKDGEPAMCDKRHWELNSILSNENTPEWARKITKLICENFSEVLNHDGSAYLRTTHFSDEYIKPK